MDIKAIIFDVGNTLISYDAPLNWQALYSPALTQTMAACNLAYTEEADAHAQTILTKYNTRVNPREYEVSSDTIFSEILTCWNVDIKNLTAAKQAFYGYFRRSSKCYDDTEAMLQSLKNRDIKIGALTDIAYGMDNEYALDDLAVIEKYIDICLTSNDVGYRKPNIKGFLMLQQSFDVPSSQIAVVGDEKKDIIGAKNSGMISVLINRGDCIKDFSQDYTISSLAQILDLIFIL